MDVETAPTDHRRTPVRGGFDAGRLPTDEQAIEALRVRRAELYESMSALEQALAAPAPGRLDAWAERVHVALVELVGDFGNTSPSRRDRMGCTAGY
jgi:hypothetical protein